MKDNKNSKHRFSICFSRRLIPIRRQIPTWKFLLNFHRSTSSVHNDFRCYTMVITMLLSSNIRQIGLLQSVHTRREKTVFRLGIYHKIMLRYINSRLGVNHIIRYNHKLMTIIIRCSFVTD